MAAGLAGWLSLAVAQMVSVVRCGGIVYVIAEIQLRALVLALGREGLQAVGAKTKSECQSLEV
jgi:hypothetical protein